MENKTYSKEDISKLINLAHKNITRIKGKDYAPDVHEIQKWIDKHLSKETETKESSKDFSPPPHETETYKKIMNGDVTEKWSKKYKDSIDCNNPKGFSQRAHCQGLKKKETKESMGASSAGSFEPAFGAPIIKRKITKINNFKTDVNEALDASASGGYDVPFPEKHRKNPLKVDGPQSIGKTRAVKDKNFPKWGGPGGVFIKIKEKCKKFPYCNQGDINAIEVLREAIDETSKKTGIPRNQIEIIVLNEIKQIFI
jgi:hypothetical protein